MRKTAAIHAGTIVVLVLVFVQLTRPYSLTHPPLSPWAGMYAVALAGHVVCACLERLAGGPGAVPYLRVRAGALVPALGLAVAWTATRYDYWFALNGYERGLHDVQVSLSTILFEAGLVAYLAYFGCLVVGLAAVGTVRAVATGRRPPVQLALGALYGALVFYLLYLTTTGRGTHLRLLELLGLNQPGALSSPFGVVTVGTLAFCAFVVVGTLVGIAGALTERYGATAVLAPPGPVTAYGVDLVVTALAPAIGIGAEVLQRAGVPPV